MKTAVQQPIEQSKDVSVQSITVTSSISCENPLFSTDYALAKSHATALEDYIYARARAYDGDGSLLNDKAASLTHASYVSAKALNGSYYVGNDYAYGNHTYKKSGYQKVYHETYNTW